MSGLSFNSSAKLSVNFKLINLETGNGIKADKIHLDVKIEGSSEGEGDTSFVKGSHNGNGEFSLTLDGTNVEFNDDGLNADSLIVNIGAESHGANEVDFPAEKPVEEDPVVTMLEKVISLFNVYMAAKASANEATTEDVNASAAANVAQDFDPSNYDVDAELNDIFTFGDLSSTIGGGNDVWDEGFLGL